MVLRNWDIVDYAVAGSRINGAVAPTMESRWATNVLPQYHAEREFNFLIFRGGINDILDVTSAATIEGYIQAYCARAKAAGFKVIVCTLTPGWVGHYPLYNATAETTRTTVNTWIKANFATWADGICKLDEVTELLDPSDTTYYTDGLHCITAAANTLIARKVQTVIETFNEATPPRRDAPMLIPRRQTTRRRAPRRRRMIHP